MEGLWAREFRPKFQSVTAVSNLTTYIAASVHVVGYPESEAHMASKLEKLLEDVTQGMKLAGEVLADKHPNATDDELSQFVLEYLTRRILPLLEAGQAMRDKGNTVRCVGFPDCDGDLPGEEHSEKCLSTRTPSTTERWDAALAAALEEK